MPIDDAPHLADTLIVQPASYVERLDWAEFFPEDRPLEMELGAGDGSFLLAWAGRHPERNFFGVERLLGRLRKIDRKGRRAGLRNLRLLRIESGYFLKYLVPPSSVRAAHVYFPDPWPKKKHHRHRLFQDEFLQSVERVLEPGGRIYVRTDNVPYYEQILEVFARHPPLRRVETPPELAAVLTDFERDFNAQGIPTSHGAWELVRTASDLPPPREVQALRDP